MITPDIVLIMQQKTKIFKFPLSVREYVTYKQIFLTSSLACAGFMLCILVSSSILRQGSNWVNSGLPLLNSFTQTHNMRQGSRYPYIETYKVGVKLDQLGLTTYKIYIICYKNKRPTPPSENSSTLVSNYNNNYSIFFMFHVIFLLFLVEVVGEYRNKKLYLYNTKQY